MEKIKFDLNMNDQTDERFDKKELEAYLQSIYKGGFSEVTEFYYVGSEKQIVFAVDEVKISDVELYNKFWNEIEKSDYGHLFFALN